MKSKTGIAIPVRMDSVRFPGKPLAKILDMPMIQHVWERANMSKYAYEVVVITPDQEIYKFMKELGAKVCISQFDHLNGTSRVSEFVDELNWKNFVILQGDEPLVIPNHLDALIDFVSSNNHEFVNVTSNLSVKDLDDPNVVKCIVNSNSEIVFMFRNNPLNSKNYIVPRQFAKVNGLYSISNKLLKEYNKLAPKDLEVSQSIEQFRFIENEVQIYQFEVENIGTSVNTKEELEQIVSILEKENQQLEIMETYLNGR